MNYSCLASPECLAGNHDQCLEHCHQNLTQFIGSVVSDYGETGCNVGDQRMFVCHQGFVVNPALIEFVQDVVMNLTLLKGKVY